MPSDVASKEECSTTVNYSLRRRWTTITSLSIEASHTVWTLMRHGITSGFLVCLVGYMLTLGNFLSGQPPVDQTDVAFQTAAGIMVTSFYSTSHFVSSAMTLGSLHRTHEPEQRWGFLKMSALLLRRMLPFYILAHILVVWSTYMVVGASSKTAASLKINMYANGLIIGIYNAGADVACRTTYRRDTLEGRMPCLYVSPYWSLYLRALRRTSSFSGVGILAAGFLHACSTLTLETELQLVGFSLASLSLKSFVLWLTRHLVLEKKMKFRTIYVMTAVPTVLINTQMRLFILLSDVTSSVRGFLLLAIVEPIMRVIKTLAMKRKLAKHDAEWASSRDLTGRSRFNKKIAVLGVKSAPTNATKEIVVAPAAKEMASSVRTASMLLNEPLAWRSSLLTFHAAESHADMCSEYIAIACSMSIYHFFRSHPKFGWYSSDPSDVSNSSDAQDVGDVSNQVLEALLMTGCQVAIEMVVDLVCCMWELSHSIPLRASDRLGGFLTAIFTSCAFVAISITALLYVHESA